MTTITIDEKKKIYWKIFYVLSALTIFELSVVFAPIPHILVDLLVVSASCAKAFFVGWVYMHLNHESKGLKFLLTAPLFVAFFYAAFLISDANVTRSRHTDPYIGQPKRFFGQRNLSDRVVDDFGNTVIVEKPAIHVEEHEGGAEHEAVGEEQGKTGEHKPEEKTPADAAATATHGAVPNFKGPEQTTGELPKSSSSSEASKH